MIFPVQGTKQNPHLQMFEAFQSIASTGSATRGVQAKLDLQKIKVWLIQWSMGSEMETYVRIGKSILKKFSDFAHDNSLDDEAEYFPVLRIMIEGVIYSFDGPISDKNKIKIKLIEFSKQLYVDQRLQNAREDE